MTNTLFDTSPRTLKFLAALVWYSGFIVLFMKSGQLFIAAEKINPGLLQTTLAILTGVSIGIIKTKYLFKRLCIKNLKRIDTLKQPRIWDFYRSRFFIFLLSMIVLGLFLSRWIQGNYAMIISLAIIELSLATALLGSSHCFWLKKQ